MGTVAEVGQVQVAHAAKVVIQQHGHHPGRRKYGHGAGKVLEVAEGALGQLVLWVRVHMVLEGRCILPQHVLDSIAGGTPRATTPLCW